MDDIRSHSQALVLILAGERVSLLTKIAEFGGQQPSKHESQCLGRLPSDSGNTPSTQAQLDPEAGEGDVVAALPYTRVSKVNGLSSWGGWGEG